MLTEEQIQSLFTFCEKHFVRYYDVQVELVDHLANAVELEMQNDPKLSFEIAIEKVHRSFGVMGFAPIVAEKQAAAEKRSRQIFWHLFKSKFGWPKVLVFFIMAGIIFTIFSLDPSLIPFFSITFVLVAWPIFFIGIFRIYKKISRSGKKFVTVNLAWISTWLFLPVYFINFMNLFTVFRSDSIIINTSHYILIPVVSIFLSLYLLFIIAAWQTITSTEEKLYQTYPEVFLSN